MSSAPYTGNNKDAEIAEFTNDAMAPWLRQHGFTSNLWKDLSPTAQQEAVARNKAIREEGYKEVSDAFDFELKVIDLVKDTPPNEDWVPGHDEKKEKADEAKKKLEEAKAPKPEQPIAEQPETPGHPIAGGSPPGATQLPAEEPKPKKNR